MGGEQVGRSFSDYEPEWLPARCERCRTHNGELRGRSPRSYAKAFEQESGHRTEAVECLHLPEVWHLRFPPGWGLAATVTAAQARPTERARLCSCPGPAGGHS